MKVLVKVLLLRVKFLYLETLTNSNKPEVKEYPVDKTVLQGEFIKVDNETGGANGIAYDFYVALEDVDLEVDAISPTNSTKL